MPDDEKREGFELGGEFFPLTVNIDHGKDLMLIDRITAMPLNAFLEAVQDGVGLDRGPVVMAVLATSIRARHTDWSVERILRMVTGDLSGLELIGLDEEEIAVPPAEAAREAAPETDGNTTSQSEDSSPSSTRQASSGSPTLSAVQG